MPSCGVLQTDHPSGPPCGSPGDGRHCFGLTGRCEPGFICEVTACSS